MRKIDLFFKEEVDKMDHEDVLYDDEGELLDSIITLEDCKASLHEQVDDDFTDEDHYLSDISEHDLDRLIDGDIDVYDSLEMDDLDYLT